MSIQRRSGGGARGVLPAYVSIRPGASCPGLGQPMLLALLAGRVQEWQEILSVLCRKPCSSPGEEGSPGSVRVVLQRPGMPHGEVTVVSVKYLGVIFYSPQKSDFPRVFRNSAHLTILKLGWFAP